MFKCSYLNEDELKSKTKKLVLPSSTSSSQVTTTKKNVLIFSPSLSTSQREISATFIYSPRISSSLRRSQVLETRSMSWVVKDETTSDGSTPKNRIFLPQLKPGKLKRRVTIGSPLSCTSVDVEESDWPPFADEDYIVFCFEEDGAFHVIMEDSPKTTTRKLQCEEHGGLTCASNEEKKVVNQPKILNRRDCLLPNKEAEDELSSSNLSSKIHIDVGDHLLATNKFMLENESTESEECRNGSVESNDSSQLDNEEDLLESQNSSEVEHSLSSSWDSTGQDGEDDKILPPFRKDYLLSNTEVDEVGSTLSSKSEMTLMFRINKLLKGNDDVSSIESDQSSGFSESESRGDHEDQPEGKEGMASESAKSSVSRQSNSSSASFKFPVLEWEWIGSPVTWPRSEKVHYKRRKPRPTCLRCCKF